jgi:hypothetical protein
LAHGRWGCTITPRVRTKRDAAIGSTWIEDEAMVTGGAAASCWRGVGDRGSRDAAFYPFDFTLQQLSLGSLAKYVYAEKPPDWNGHSPRRSPSSPATTITTRSSTALM